MCQIHISRSLAARVGTHDAHVGVRQDDTVRDVIDRLAAEYGPQVRTGMMEGERLRSDVIAVRNPDAEHESVTAESRLEPGDTVEFHLTSEHEKISQVA